MRILGIDPGYGILGWSIIEKDFNLIDFGTIETKSSEEIAERLVDIHKQLSAIISLYSPSTVAIEKLFFAKNTKTAIDVAKTIGVILLTIKIAGLDYAEYTPSQVKQAMTGFGRASKEQMQVMIQRLFNIKEIPKPDDAADALAIAACHSCNSSINLLKKAK
ncbi:MAG: crossover junction endodeoxyribonuclease RuvC [bacterium]|nr:crossover junction endodeoxyribonuclease RuvC [bacterium]